MSTAPRRRRLAGVLVLALGACLLLVAPVPAAPPARAAADDGSATQARGDQSVTVSKTTNLSRERVSVSWRGMRPSGTALDVYGRIPLGVAVLQCRGTDRATIDRSQCWARSQSGRGMQQWLDAQETDPTVRYKVAGDKVVAPYVDAAGQPAEGIPFRTLDGRITDAEGAFLRIHENDLPDISPVTQNAVWAATGADGTGSTQFTINTKAENPSLGCSSRRACSLVVVPLTGEWDCPRTTDGTLDLPAAAIASVEGICANPGFENTDGAGARDWSIASNWKNRYVFPLTFLPEADLCPERSDRAEFVGSENISQAMRQWLPARCTATTGALDYTSTPEPDARRLFASSSAISSSHYEADAAVTTLPLSKDAAARKPAYAPLSISSFVIAFNLTASGGPERGKRLSQLVLNARLIAKLLTQSYGTTEQTPDTKPFENPNIATGNPADITKDPELLALNPNLPTRKLASGAVLVYLAGVGQLGVSVQTSDVWHQVTAYLAGDAQARDFLNGVPDQWGMRVNKKYKGWLGATDTYPLRDDYAYTLEQLATKVPKLDENGDIVKNPDGSTVYVDGPPYNGGVWAGVPYLAQKANLGANWAETAESAMVSWPINRGAVTGSDSPLDPWRLTRAPQGKPTDGSDLVITTAAEAARRALPTAALVNPVSGNAIAADRDGMTAALNDVVAKNGMWEVDPATIDGSGYPGTMISYAAVPTTGLPAPLATGLAGQLRWMTTDGQTPGIRAGQLPGGYVPLTPPLVAHAQRVADALAAQAGRPPQPPPGKDPLADGDDPTPADTTAAASGGPGSGAGGPAGDAAGDPKKSGAAGAPETTDNAIRLTSGEQLGWLRWGIPLLLLAGLFAGVLGPLVRLAATGGLSLPRPLLPALTALLRKPLKRG